MNSNKNYIPEHEEDKPPRNPWQVLLLAYGGWIAAAALVVGGVYGLTKLAMWLAAH
jgi:hypothetical protein